jgi:hypothetical protein
MNGNLWTHNDAANEGAKLYRIDPTNGSILQTVTLEGITNIDWEDITEDDTHIYIGDVGNNIDGARGDGANDLRILKFEKNKIPQSGDVTISNSNIETIIFIYEDQPRPLDGTKGSNNTEFDCEAIVYAGGKIHLFTKNWLYPKTVHYTIPTSASEQVVATKVETFNLSSESDLITGADYQNGKLCLVGYNSDITKLGKTFLWVFDGVDSTCQMSSATRKQEIKLGSAINYGQIESVAFDNNGDLFLTNEKVLTIPPRLYSYALSSYIWE